VHFAREGAVDGPANHIVLGSVELPLGLWSKNRGPRSRARAAASIAGEAETLEGRALLARVAGAHAELTSAAERAAVLDGGAATPLEASLGLYARGFERGEFSVLELAAARQTFARAQLSALQAHADYLRARVELEYVLDADLDAAFPQPGERGEP
jgi:outer membrane protein, heavy metal efflux system